MRGKAYEDIINGRFIDLYNKDPFDYVFFKTETVLGILNIYFLVQKIMVHFKLHLYEVAFINS